MNRGLLSLRSVVLVVGFLFVTSVVLAEEPPKTNPASGKITLIKGNTYFEWQCGAVCWKCRPAAGQKTIKGLDGKNVGDTVKATWVHDGGDRLLVSEVTSP
jgi:hypothetical protein